MRCLGIFDLLIRKQRLVAHWAIVINIPTRCEDNSMRQPNSHLAPAPIVGVVAPILLFGLGGWQWTLSIGE